MKRAVLLVAHGSPDDLADMPAFLRNVRRGRDAPESLVLEMRKRYEAIGGSSPLLSITRSVAKKLEARVRVPVRVGMRLWRPYARDVLAELARDGIERVVVLALAQHSTHVYNDAVRKARDELVREGGKNVELEPIDAWGRTPALLDAQAKRIREKMAPLSEAERNETLLVLTAHSLPRSVIAAGDPYEREFVASAMAVRERVADLAPHAMHAYQSQGEGGDWLGPDLVCTLDIAKARGFRRLIVAPIGFLADHLEVLYDIDIEMKARAEQRSLDLVRTPSLNDADDFIDVLAGLVR
jgi:ferrochelatase